MMRIHISVVACILACHVLVQAGGEGEGENGSSDGTAATLINRFLSDAEAPLTSYRAFRTLEAETRGGGLRARLTAWTSHDPVLGSQYSIVEETGSGIIRRKVLRAALEAEQSMRANGEFARGALTTSNYDFTADSHTEDGLMRVGIRPKRRDTALLRGSILLTEPEGDLVRVEGFLIKKPSIWTREVEVMRRYARIHGVRVPIEMQSTARVLLTGRSTFSMLYEYASINGVPVPPSTSQPAAEGSR